MVIAVSESISGTGDWLSPILQCRPLVMFPFHILPLLCQEKSNMFVKKKNKYKSVAGEMVEL